MPAHVLEENGCMHSGALWPLKESLLDTADWSSSSCYFLLPCFACAPELLVLLLDTSWLSPGSDLGLSHRSAPVLCMTLACLATSLNFCLLTTDSLTFPMFPDYVSCFALSAVTWPRCLLPVPRLLYLPAETSLLHLLTATCLQICAVCTTTSSPGSCCSSYLLSTWKEISNISHLWHSLQLLLFWAWRSLFPLSGAPSTQGEPSQHFGCRTRYVTIKLKPFIILQSSLLQNCTLTAICHCDMVSSCHISLRKRKRPNTFFGYTHFPPNPGTK